MFIWERTWQFRVYCCLGLILHNIICIYSRVHMGSSTEAEPAIEYSVAKKKP
jgi:hypothetical protein